MTEEHIIKEVDEEALSLLDHFHFCLQTNALNESGVIKEQLNNQSLIFDEQTYAIYQLLSFRYYIATENKKQADHYSHWLQDKATRLTIHHFGDVEFYYNFMKGFYAYFYKDYVSALDYYQLAEKSLTFVGDNSIKADFYYHLATLHYHMNQPVRAVDYATSARYLYRKDGRFAKQSISCDLVKGVCLILNQLYTAAETLFLQDLEKTTDTQLRLYLMYNLGYLYVEMKNYEEALIYFKAVYHQPVGGHKVLYFLALCHYKLNKVTQAKAFVKEGLDLCRENQEDEYVHHLIICQMLYDESCDPTLKDIEAEMAYFESNHLWYYVENYYFELAEKYNNSNNTNRALHFYHKAFLSKNNAI